jgi:hypothetical protein
MIPTEKLFEIIQHAALNEFDIKIEGNFATVEFYMYNDHIIRYNWQEKSVIVIRNEPEIPDDWDNTRPLKWLENEVEYYNKLLELAKLIQENIQEYADKEKLE